MSTFTRRTVLLIAPRRSRDRADGCLGTRPSTGPQTVAGTKPAIVLKTGNLGKVLATPARFGIYYWSVEKKAGGKIRCTGAVRCRLAARVRQGDGAEARQGRCGDLRDDQARHEAPADDQRAPRRTRTTTIRRESSCCDDVDGWFAVRPL